MTVTRRLRRRCASAPRAARPRRAQPSRLASGKPYLLFRTCLTPVCGAMKRRCFAVVRRRFSPKGARLTKRKTEFGIRLLLLDTRHGLRVNGRSVKLRGACVHHDSGVLGAATFADAEYRRVRILKEAGFNAIRTAHNPSAPALLRACDEVGMYVMEEAFDAWTRSKADYDYAVSFDDWWQRDIEAMVSNAFNHPSVVLYSVGNEIPEGGLDAGAALCTVLANTVKALDPTRCCHRLHQRCVLQWATR